MITPYKKDGKMYYRVRVEIRSTVDPSIRPSKSRSGFTKLSEAKRAEKKLKDEVMRLVFRQEEQDSSWKLIVDGWEQSILKGDIFAKQIKKSTLEDYLKVIRDHTADWSSLPVNEITAALAWSTLSRIEREISISRRKRLRTAIDAVFNWAIKSQRVTGVKVLPTSGYSSDLKEEEKVPEILSLEEIRIFLKAARDYKHPWYPVWVTALYTGMRSGELFALRWEDLSFEHRQIRVHRNWTSKDGFGPTKGRYWRNVPLENSDVLTFFKELNAQSKGSQFVLPRFQSWQDGRQAEILRAFLVGIGLPSVRFHALRSCFATQLIRDGIAPGIIMKICGWKDLKTMQRYIKLAGIEVSGATEGLKLLPERDVMGRIVNLFEHPKS